MSHVADRPDFETRFSLTKELLEGIRIPQQPPQDFDPLGTTPEELEKHGLSPCPDKEKAPDAATRWEHPISRPLEFVRPEFKIIEEEGSRSSSSDPGMIKR